MQIQITDAGVSALNSAGSTPLTLGIFKLGDDFNYTPEATDTGIHGTQLFQGNVTAPLIINANLIKYGINLDYSIGDIYFGEIGIFLPNNELFALATNDTLIAKIKQNGSNEGNQIRIDLYVSVVGQNYSMWTDLANSNSSVQVTSVLSVDHLTPSRNATPNIFVVGAVHDKQTSFLAYTDRIGLWTFNQYAYNTYLDVVYTIVSATTSSVSIDIAYYNDFMVPDALGDIILQFTSGANYSICRNVSATVQNINSSIVTFSFSTNLLIVPVTGDKFSLFQRTTDYVTSINNIMPYSGNVSLEISDIPGLPEALTSSALNNKSVAINAGSTLTLDLTSASGIENFYVTLGQPTCAITFNLGSLQNGLTRKAQIVFIQGTGSNLVTWPGNISFPQGLNPVLSFQIHAIDIVSLTYDNDIGVWIGLPSGSWISA